MEKHEKLSEVTCALTWDGATSTTTTTNSIIEMVSLVLVPGAVIVCVCVYDMRHGPDVTWRHGLIGITDSSLTHS